MVFGFPEGRWNRGCSRTILAVLQAILLKVGQGQVYQRLIDIHGKEVFLPEYPDFKYLKYGLPMMRIGHDGLGTQVENSFLLHFALNTQSLRQ